MRQIEIVEEPRSQHPWVAVDRDTREPVLRMQRLETLLRISKSLDWEIITEASMVEPAPEIRHAELV